MYVICPFVWVCAVSYLSSSSSSSSQSHTGRMHQLKWIFFMIFFSPDKKELQTGIAGAVCDSFGGNTKLIVNLLWQNTNDGHNIDAHFYPQNEKHQTLFVFRSHTSFNLHLAQVILLLCYAVCLFVWLGFSSSAIGIIANI